MRKAVTVRVTVGPGDEHVPQVADGVALDVVHVPQAPQGVGVERPGGEGAQIEVLDLEAGRAPDEGVGIDAHVSSPEQASRAEVFVADGPIPDDRQGSGAGPHGPSLAVTSQGHRAQAPGGGYRGP